jgi:hypothetical protein
VMLLERELRNHVAPPCGRRRLQMARSPLRHGAHPESRLNRGRSFSRRGRAAPGGVPGRVSTPSPLGSDGRLMPRSLPCADCSPANLAADAAAPSADRLTDVPMSFFTISQSSVP